MLNTSSKSSPSSAPLLAPGLLAALILWGTVAVPIHGQTAPTPAPERPQVSAADSMQRASAHPDPRPAEGSFLSWRHIITILTALVVVGVIVVLYVHGWNVLMIKEVEKRTHKLKAELDERTRAEESLRANVESLALTLNAIGHGIVTTDSTGNITRMNAPAEMLTGWPFAEAKGRPIQDVVRFVDELGKEPIPHHPIADVLHGSAMAKVGPRSIFLRRDGKEYRVADTSAPLRDNAGNLQGAVLVFRDVTEQYALEDSLRQSQKMESVGRLAGGVAHDFNNLLSGIIGFSEILLSRLPEGDRNREYVDDIILTSQRAADLTSKLLAFSHRGSIQSVSVDVHDIIREVIAILSETIDRRIQIHRNLTAPSPIVEGDPSQIQNAILNLALNARDAMPNGGVMTLSTGNVTLDAEFCRDNPFEVKPGAYLEITVTDTGVGMTPEIMSKMFEPFFTTKKSGVGTGLGLSAVYGIVRDHHGAIAVHSEPNRGSLFKVYIPAAAAAADVQPPKRSVQFVRGTGKILLVDDERVIRMVGEQILSTLGYTVVTVENGLEAVKYVEEHPDEVDLVILDVVMPKMNGPDTYLKLRSIEPGIKVLLSSGFTMGSDIRDLMEEKGLCGFIQKPYRAMQMSQQIAEVMAKKA